ncbi:hypothetical protein PCANC_20225 [Puccinia coronata f. sp. avenae]|uniref:Uncharacterized protein n=1 Tax=Puccinia coronata f. sp. avenae TaxID=200324 RepID=A0A2N5U3S7_9BASI|nr:hypothetical protein PCASD_18444 [Puccinia coronata f. sp. avenae]PLW32396.1 hypothetical protein PCANC_20225 [Puccinia coronata f. sp. avenae]
MEEQTTTKKTTSLETTGSVKRPLTTLSDDNDAKRTKLAQPSHLINNHYADHQDRTKRDLSINPLNNCLNIYIFELVKSVV